MAKVIANNEFFELCKTDGDKIEDSIENNIKKYSISSLFEMPSSDINDKIFRY